MKDRIKYIDNLRFFAILNIVLLHVISIFRWKYFGNNSTNYFILTFLDSFTRVGLPIFFMISGILMLRKEESEDYASFLKKRVLRLVTAYCFFSAIYYVYKTVTYHDSFSLFELVRRITSSKAEYHLWFMPVIIVIYILIPFIQKLIKSLNREELKRMIFIVFILSSGMNCVYTISSLLGYPIMGNFILPNLMGYMNYLFIGYYLADSDYKVSKRLIVLSILSIICIPFATSFVSRGEINDLFLDSLSIFVMAPSILIFLLFKNSKVKLPAKVRNMISKSAKQVFYVYLIHVLFLDIIQDHFKKVFSSNSLIKDIGIILLLWIVVLILSFVFTMIWNQIKEIYKKYNHKIKNALIKTLSIGIMGFFIIVLGNLLLNPYHFIKMNYGLLIVGFLLWIGLYYLVKRYLDFLLHNKYLRIVCMILFIGLQILIGYAYMVKPTWDFGEVYRIATTFAKNPGIFFRDPYLYLCNNNIMFTVLFDFIFKFFYIIGIKNHFLELGILINIMMIDASIIYTYRLIHKVNPKTSKIFLIFILLSSPLLFYIPIFYTDTMSLPFAIASIYYLYKYLYESQKKLSAVLAGVWIGVGALIKPTVLIIGVAVLIFLFLRKKKINYYLFFSLFLIPIITVLIGQKIFINHYFDKEYMEHNKLPTAHYILIGLEESGGFNRERYTEINEVENQKEREIIAKNNLKKRIQEMIKKKEIIPFYNRKIAFTWTDGTFFAFEKLHREPFHTNFTKYVYSNENNDILYWTFSNTEWIIVLVLIILGIVFQKYLPEKLQEIQMLSNISIVGIILFLLMWETRSRYLVNYVPIFMLDAYIGLNALSNYINSKKEGRPKK